MSERCIAEAFAEVMVYNEAMKKWQSPVGNSGVLSKVEILQYNNKQAYRIVSIRENDGRLIINCNIHTKLKYHSATATFHQWRDENRQVYGLNFRTENDARTFNSVIEQVIDHLAHQAFQQPEYQSINHDNVYQDPQQHLTHINSAPAFSEHHPEDNHNPYFRKTSQHNVALAQQPRRTSQSSNLSAGTAYQQEQTDSRAYSSPSATTIPPAPPAPPSSNIPPAPPAPPGGAIAPVSSNAPPPPPPPPPNFAATNGGPKTSLAEQLKMRSAALNKTSNREPAKVEEKPAAATSYMSELEATINKRKMTQAKSDAVDSKSNTSNASSDSGTGTAPINNGFSVSAGSVKKWSEKNGNGVVNGCDSPKTHRKLPSNSSLTMQEEPKTNGINGGATVTSEILERFKAELMVEVRLEINKAKQEIIETIRSELARR